MEEKQTEERRTKEKEAKENVTTKESLRKRNAWKSCRKESGKGSVRDFSSSEKKAKNLKDFLAGETQGEA